MNKGAPVHWLNSIYSKLWCRNFKKRTEIRDQFAKKMADIYGGQVHLADANLNIVSTINSDGGWTDYERPFTTVKAWQVANKPKPEHCVCYNFTDPEGGTYEDPKTGTTMLKWGMRLSGKHHPACLFAPESEKVFSEASARFAAKIARKEEIRGDELESIQSEILGVGETLTNLRQK